MAYWRPAHCLPSQCTRQENRRLCKIFSAFVDRNLPGFGHRTSLSLPFQKSFWNRALVKRKTKGNNMWKFNCCFFITLIPVKKSATGTENTGIRRIPAGIGNLAFLHAATIIQCCWGRGIKSPERESTPLAEFVVPLHCHGFVTN